MVYNIFMFFYFAFLVGVAWGVPLLLGHFLFELIENNKESS
jgi:hypothetical protein